jgi:hypothetical protein
MRLIFDELPRYYKRQNIQFDRCLKNTICFGALEWPRCTAHVSHGTTVTHEQTRFEIAKFICHVTAGWLSDLLQTEDKILFLSYYSSLFFLPTLIAGQSVRVSHLSLVDLLPDTDQYMTYEGSTTHPGCWETTTWIVMNKPIYVTRQEASWSQMSLLDVWIHNVCIKISIESWRQRDKLGNQNISW